MVKKPLTSPRRSLSPSNLYTNLFFPATPVPPLPSSGQSKSFFQFRNHLYNGDKFPLPLFFLQTNERLQLPHLPVTEKSGKTYSLPTPELNTPLPASMTGAGLFIPSHNLKLTHLTPKDLRRASTLPPRPSSVQVGAHSWGRNDDRSCTL